MPITESRKKENKKWADNNKDKMVYYQYKSKSKNFILKYATLNDLKDLKKLLDDKIEELENKEI